MRAARDVFQRRVAALLLSTLAGLALWHLVVIRPGLGYELESHRAGSLAEFFGSSRNRAVRSTFKFYAQATRFSGATLYLTDTRDQQGWFLEHVAGLEVVVVEPTKARELAGPAPSEACRGEDAISSSLEDGVVVRICPGQPGSDYVLVESPLADGFLFVPVSPGDDR